MEILFTNHKSSSLSKLIRKVTHEPVSHVAIKYGPFVVHSNWKGINVTSYVKFLEHNQIMFSYPVETKDNQLLQTLHKEGAGYDLPALIYLGLKFGLGKIGIKLPKKNLWKISGMYICTEFVSYVIYGSEDSTVTPYQLYLRLLNAKV